MIGSPYPIDGGASTRTLWRRVGYGGKKGRAAKRRLRRLERRIALWADAMLDNEMRRVVGMLNEIRRIEGAIQPIVRFAYGLFPKHGREEGT
jgi:hypothetical protein